MNPTYKLTVFPQALITYPSARGGLPHVAPPNAASDPFMTKLWEKTERFQRSPLFELAMAKLPNYEVDDTRRLIKLIEAKASSTAYIDNVSNEELRIMRVLCRFQNPFCANSSCLAPELGARQCFSPAHVKTKVLWCSCCALIAYCSKECQRAYHPIHKAWAAALPHSVRLPHEDPMGPTIVDVESGLGYYVSATGDICVHRE